MVIQINYMDWQTVLIRRFVDALMVEEGIPTKYTLRSFQTLNIGVLKIPRKRLLAMGGWWCLKHKWQEIFMKYT